MNIRKFSLIICLCLFTSGLCADDVWTGAKKVVSVQVTNDGGFLVQLDSEISSDCSHAGKDVLLVSPFQNEVTIAGAKSLLSTALIAFSTESNVNIMYSNDTINCWGKYLSISK